MQRNTNESCNEIEVVFKGPVNRTMVSMIQDNSGQFTANPAYAPPTKRSRTHTIATPQTSTVAASSGSTATGNVLGVPESTHLDTSEEPSLQQVSHATGIFENLPDINDLKTRMESTTANADIDSDAETVIVEDKEQAEPPKLITEYNGLRLYVSKDGTVTLDEDEDTVAKQEITLFFGPKKTQVKFFKKELSSRMPYFDNLFYNMDIQAKRGIILTMDDFYLYFPNVKPESFKLCLELIDEKRDLKGLSIKTIVEVLEVVIQCDISKLHSLCVNHLGKLEISLENACEFARALLIDSSSFSRYDITRRLKSFISDHAGEILKLKSYQDTYGGYARSLLKFCKIKTFEMMIYKTLQSAKDDEARKLPTQEQIMKELFSDP